ncbi:MAG: hypothetical protein EOO63_04950, partial [Hymenobacter sp.]
MNLTLRLLSLLLALAALLRPGNVWAQCVTTSTVPYTTAPATDPTGKKTATETVAGISFTYGGYAVNSAPNNNATTSTLDVFEHSATAYTAQISGPALVWRQQRTSALPTGTTTNLEFDANTPYYTYVTLTFAREVSNLSFVVQDIDKGLQGVTPDGGSTYTDEFIVQAKNAAGTLVTLPTGGVTWGSNKTSEYISYATGAINIGGNTDAWQGARGTSLNGTSSAANANGTTTFTFPNPVKTVTMSFRNLNTRTNRADGTANPARIQTIGIQSISWCGQADVTTTLAGPASLTAGVQSGNYTATYTNNGPGVAASTTRTVTIPANTASAVTSSAGANTVTGSQTAGWTITFPAGTNVAAGTAGQVSYTFTVTPTTAASLTAISNTSTTSDEGTNPTPATNTASVTTNVTPQADVVTTLANVTGASVQAGSPITYTATVQNNGPSLASNVAPQVQLPAGLTAAAFTTLPTNASYDNNSGILTLPTSNLTSGTSATYSFTFTAPNYTTTVSGVASSTAGVLDPTAANNNGSSANAQVSTTVTLANNGCAGTAYPGAGGSGLYAEYYKGYFADAMDYFSTRTAGITRTDGTVNFATSNSWGNLLLPAGNPVASNTVDDPNTYSARYRGAISVPATGSYTFYLTSDDASYMWIDGAALAATPDVNLALIKNGNAHSAITVQTTVTLTAGQHNILIFYGENGGDNVLKFEYSGGPGNITRQIVPNSVLCPTQAATADLATIISGPQTAVVGQTVYYQSTTTNLGTDATTNVVPTITLASKPAANTVNVTNGTYDAGTGIVTFNAVNLAANASVANTVSFVAQAAPTTATGKAASSSLNSYDPVATNNDGSATTANVTTTVAPTGAAGTAANCATAGKD